MLVILYHGVFLLALLFMILKILLKIFFILVKIGSEFIICVKRVGCILRKFLPCYQHLSFGCFYQDSHRVSCSSNMELFLSSLSHTRELLRLNISPNSQMCNISSAYLIPFNYHSDTRQALSPLILPYVKSHLESEWDFWQSKAASDDSKWD